jgi:hypothetical protein
MKLFRAACSHKFDYTEIHRFHSGIVACECWKCDKLCTAGCGLDLPGTLQGRPQLPCPNCEGTGKVHQPPSSGRDC